jgi:DNA adenine methylase
MPKQEHTPYTLDGLKSYPGGKSGDGTIQRLINEIPPHANYIEPFLGGGAVMRHKRPAESINLGIELDAQLASLWREQAPHWMKVQHGDGLAYLDRLGRNPDTVDCFDETFIFLDPPYLDETLSAGRAPYQCRFKYSDQVNLLLTLQRIDRDTNAMMMLCALPNLLTESQLTGWRTFQYQNKTRRGMQIEQVWMNYPAPERLHDTRYLGKNYRERERIRRRSASIKRQLERMPPLERQAVLEVITGSA